MQTVFTGQLCIECDACVDICPMDCITFTANGEEADLRTRLQAPAKNLTQDLYVANDLKTGRVMVKDEDVCLHCGLCAERCPTGAWDMQKYLIDMTHAEQACQSKSVNDFVVRFANVNGSGSASANELFARAVLRMGVPVSPRNIFPSNIQGLPTWYEVRVSEAGHLGARGGTDMMVAMNPQTWDKDVAIDRARRLSASTIRPSRCRSRNSATTSPSSACRSPRSPTRPIPIRASASCSRTSSISARCRRCSTWIRR